MKAEVLTITPEMAKAMLGRNSNNRPLNKSSIRRYADEMRDGRWKLNGEAVILNGNRLMDGQHRLHACILAGVSFTTLVVEGIEDSAFDTIDQGDKRTAGNILSMAGCPNATCVAGAFRWITTIRASMGKGSITYHAAARGCTATMALEFVEKNPQIHNSVQAALSAYSSCRVFTPSMVGAFHFLFSEKDRNAADDFVNAIGTGEGLRVGDPRMTLRNRMIERATKVHKERPE